MGKIDDIKKLAGRVVSEREIFNTEYKKLLETTISPALCDIADGFFRDRNKYVTPHVSGHTKTQISFTHVDKLDVNLAYTFAGDFGACRVLFLAGTSILSRHALAELATKENVKALVLNELEREIKAMVPEESGHA